MAKEKTVYICKNCGYRSIKWLGKCPSCGEWNTLEEQTAIAFAAPAPKTPARARRNQPQAQLLSGIRDVSTDRTSTDIAELDRVLGGGVVNGELILLSGDPGIGKSTLALQMAANIAQKATVLYISAEESAEQVKMRANRLDLSGQIYILPQTDLSAAEEALSSLNPQFVIVDSIQTVYLPQINSSPGSITQLKECTERLMHWAKVRGISTLIIGHVTKEGTVAGPKMLEHMVDCVLFFEGERHYQYRILRALKNRFGTTDEIGIFSMADKGLSEVLNPSASFIAERANAASGSAVTALLEGTRPLLVEMQALVIPSFAANPRRTASGVDFNRLLILLAVLEKHAGLRLSNQDVFANTIGGFRIDEPAADMALLAALASAYNNQPLKNDCLILGEVGLSGEVRRINHLKKRLNEGAKLGLKYAIVPKHNLDDISLKDLPLQIIGVETVKEALQVLLK